MGVEAFIEVFGVSECLECHGDTCDEPHMRMTSEALTHSERLRIGESR